jgi:hypothetical protein
MNHLDLHRTPRALLLAAGLVLALAVACSSGGDKHADNVSAPALAAALQAGGDSVPRGEGAIVREDLGFSVFYPSEWEGFDREDGGGPAAVSGAGDWKILTFLRWETAPVPPGESPSLIVRVISSETDSGRKAIEDYFQQLAAYSKQGASTGYDVVSGLELMLTPQGSDDANVLLMDAEPLEPAGADAVWLKTRYQLHDGRLFAFGYFRNSPGELRLDLPLVREIFSSIDFQ